MRYFTGLNSDTGQTEVINLEEEIESQIGEVQTEVEGKLDAPEVEGTEGQVLTIGSSGKAEWQDTGSSSYVKNNTDLIIAENSVGKTIADVEAGESIWITETANNITANYEYICVGSVNNDITKFLRKDIVGKSALGPAKNTYSYWGKTMDTYITTTYAARFASNIFENFGTYEFETNNSRFACIPTVDDLNSYLQYLDNLVANLDGVATAYWTRTHVGESTYGSIYEWVKTDGTIYFNRSSWDSEASSSKGCRPVIIIKKIARIDGDNILLPIGSIIYDGTVDKIQEEAKYYKFSDQDARASITAIKDGTSIDSFGDVESALALKQDTLTAGTGIDIVNDEISVDVSDLPQSDWAQNTAAASDYVKNRTHYPVLRTELADISWDGDFTSANAPTLVESVDDTEGSGYFYRTYKLSANPLNFNIKELYSAVKIYCEDTVDVDIVGTYADMVKAVIVSYFYLTTGTELTDDMYEQLASQFFDLESLQPVSIEVGQNDGDAYLVAYGSEEDVFDFCDPQIVFIVTEPGTYDPISVMTNGDIVSSAEYTVGIYGVSVSEPSDPDNYSAYTPVYAADVVKLDDKYLPDSIDVRFNQIGSRILAYDVINLVEDQNNPGTLISTKTATEIYQMFVNNKVVFIKHPLLVSQVATYTKATLGSGSTIADITIQTQPYLDDGNLYCKQYVIAGNAVTISTIEIQNSLTISSTTKTLAEWISTLNTEVSGLNSALGSGVIE